MVDVELIFPPVSTKERYRKGVAKDAGGHVMPLGIAMISAYLKEKGIEVSVIDAAPDDLSPEQILDKIKKDSPKLVGISALTMTFHKAVMIAETIKKELPDVLVVLGGVHPTVVPSEVLSGNDCFDILVIGEGEFTFHELFNAYKEHNFNREKLLNSASIKSVKGLAFKRGREIIFTERRELLVDLDQLPFPDRDAFDISKYRPLPNNYKLLPSINLIAFRGCPFDCTFCSETAVSGRRLRCRSPEKVIDEIKLVIDKYGAKEISFWDDNLTVNSKWINRLLDLIIAEKLNIVWTCCARVDTVTPELLHKMKLAGCWNIFYGCESGSQQLLDNINKKTTLEQIKRAVALTKKEGIEVRASFMLALPGETPELAQKTIDFANEIEPDYVQYGVTTPYPGTQLFKDVEKWGTLIKDYTKYTAMKPVFIPYGYKDINEIMKMERKAMVSFYLRPKYILNRLLKIKSFDDIKRYYFGLKFVLSYRRYV